MSPSEDVQERQRRAGLNESQFRDVNEVIEDQHEGSAFTEYVCECSRKTCEASVPLSVDEYEEVRKVPTHFFVAPGHRTPEAERIVRETPRYHIVEKIGLAGAVAERLNPRDRGRH